MYHPQPCWFEEGATDTEVMGGCEIMSLSHTAAAAENIKPKEQNLKKERSCSFQCKGWKLCENELRRKRGWQLASSTTHHPVKYKLHHSVLRWRLSNELKWGWVPKYYPSTSRPPGQRPSSNFSSGAVATFLVAVASGQSIGGCLVISSNSEYFGLPPKHPWVARVSCLSITTVQQQKSSLLVLSFSVNHCPLPNSL